MGTWSIRGGRIWQGNALSENKEITYDLPAEKDRTISLNEEDLILPGFIDMHSHLWSPAAESLFGMPEIMHYQTGIAGFLDAGTYGYENWAAANQYWQNATPAKIRSFISVQPKGLAIFPPSNPTPVEDIDIGKLEKVISDNKGDALGVKIQLGFFAHKSPETDLRYMEIGREVCDATGTNMMVHISGQCMDASLQASFMQKGDIITHIYSGFENTILDNNGHVRRAVWEAKERGVKFDIGHAGKHFSWKVFRAAMEEGLTFDFMGSDLGFGNYRNPDKFPIYDQFHMFSGFLNAGIPLEESIKTLTSYPEEYTGLRFHVADTCLVLRKHMRETRFGDGLGEYIEGKYEYRPEWFMDHHRLVFNKELF